MRMPYYNVCLYCGDHLDPGERCDCQDASRGKEADWQERPAFSIIAAHCETMRAQKKTASEEDSLLTTTNITPNITNCQF